MSEITSHLLAMCAFECEGYPVSEQDVGREVRSSLFGLVGTRGLSLGVEVAASLSAGGLSRARLNFVRVSSFVLFICS